MYIAHTRPAEDSQAACEMRLIVFMFFVTMLLACSLYDDVLGHFYVFNIYIKVHRMRIPRDHRSTFARWVPTRSPTGNIWIHICLLVSATHVHFLHFYLSRIYELVYRRGICDNNCLIVVIWNYRTGNGSVNLYRYWYTYNEWIVYSRYPFQPVFKDLF